MPRLQSDTPHQRKRRAPLLAQGFGLLQLVIFASVVFYCSFAPQAFAASSDPPAYKDDIRPYVEFLSKEFPDPVDYIMGLFERYDMVILCERFHPEITQYHLFFKLVSDERFIRDVGHVFTELGSSSRQADFEKVMDAPGLSEKELSSRLMSVYRDLNYYPLWGNYNPFDFWRRVYILNQTLDPDRKIRIHLSDVPFNWDGMTIEKYKEFDLANRENRDRIMANQIDAGFKAIQNSNQQRKKALVIVNYRHAFNDFHYDDGTQGDNAGRYLFEAYRDRVCNVMINECAHGKNGTYTPAQNGKWDAAFRVVGNPNIGFDFKGSPFGSDQFDYWPHKEQVQNVDCQDVFTGFVFWLPLKEHIIMDGCCPGNIDKEFAKELSRRWEITGRSYKPWMLRLWGLFRGNRMHQERYDELGKHEKTIRFWLK